jgi:putative transposase
MRKAKIYAKSDERILGDGEFVSQVLAENNEVLERQTALKNKGVDVDYIAQRVAGLLDMKVDDIWLPGRTKGLVKGRSLVCYWGVRDLGESMASLARRCNISAVAVGKAVRRGAEIARKEEVKLL